MPERGTRCKARRYPRWRHAPHESESFQRHVVTRASDFAELRKMRQRLAHLGASADFLRISRIALAACWTSSLFTLRRWRHAVFHTFGDSSHPGLEARQFARSVPRRSQRNQRAEVMCTLMPKNIKIASSWDAPAERCDCKVNVSPRDAK